MERSPSDEIRDLLNLSSALTTAVDARFMAPDHAATIWKKFLRSTSVDVQKMAQTKAEDK